MNSKYYLGEYIESYDGELFNVEVVREFDIEGEKTLIGIGVVGMSEKSKT